ncbi:MAG: hypothetical protein ABIJ96_08060 [Elusimicrobiota bacterium]
MGSCYKCGGNLDHGDYGRGKDCPGCGEDTKICRNCDLYAPGLNSDCREPQADLIKNKERANYCEFFKSGNPKRSAPPESGTSKDAFSALFKKKPGG